MYVVYFAQQSYRGVHAMEHKRNVLCVDALFHVVVLFVDYGGAVVCST